MENVETRIRAYVAPLLITGFSIVMWSIITEIRADVKALLSATSQTKIKVAEIDKRLESAERILYAQKVYALKPEEDE